MSSTGFINHGTATLNNCNITGIHSGVTTQGTIYANGGTYEGYGHGGFYITGGVNNYICNAIIRECDMPESYTAGTGMNNASGMYIGSSSNITVNIDNCDIYASGKGIALRGSGKETNNTIKISNSRMHKLSSAAHFMRIDDETHRIYIGKGCEFKGIPVISSNIDTWARIPENSRDFELEDVVVFEPNAVYKKN